MVPLSDIDHLKRTPNFSFGDIPNVELIQAIHEAEAFVRSWCAREFSWGEYTEYFDADRRDYLLSEYPVSQGEPLSDPVVPKPRLWYDPEGMYGAVAGAYAADTEMTYGSDFVVIPGKARGILRVFPGNSTGRYWGNWGRNGYGRFDYGHTGPTYGTGAVKVTYWAGWKAGQVPEDLKLVIDQMAMGVILSSSQGGIASGLVLQEEQLGQARVKYAQSSGGTSSSSTKAAMAGGPLPGGIAGVLARYRNWPVG